MNPIANVPGRRETGEALPSRELSRDRPPRSRYENRLRKSFAFAVHSGEKEELATRFGLAGGGGRPTRTDAENDTTSSGVGSLNPEEEMSGVATTATTATATIEDPEKPEVVEAATR